MNKIISKIGALLVIISVALFALFMPFSSFWSYFVCMILAFSYLIMAAGLHSESDKEHKVAANAGLLFAAVYAVLILLVYYAQTTSVRLSELNHQATLLLDYSYGGLFFFYDLLGYGMMALSTFFFGLAMKAETKVDKWLKWLMIIHGIFFLSCFIMPLTGVFSFMAEGHSGNGGILALEIWCAYFLPIGVLAFIHFNKKNN